MSRGWRIGLFGVVVLPFFTLIGYRFVHDVVRHGWNASEIVLIAFLLLFPVVIWMSLKLSRTGTAANMANTRASHPGATVMAAGWAGSFMPPPLQPAAMPAFTTKGYRLYVVVATTESLALYSYRYRRVPVLAGELPWKSVRLLSVVPVKPGQERLGTRFLSLSVDPGGTDLSRDIELYLCRDDGKILLGDAFDEAKTRIEHSGLSI
jgi:hypothetical protein